MATVVMEASPLAAYLEGTGEAEPFNATDPNYSNPTPPPTPNFAPVGIPRPTTRYKENARSTLRGGMLLRLRRIAAAAVNSTLGSADNERFLEHFQFHIIASQLLSDNFGPVSSHAAPTSDPPQQRSTIPTYTANTAGAACAASVAFAFVWIIHWVKHGSIPASIAWRSTIALCTTICLAVGLYAYITRQWLQYLRRSTIDSVAKFVNDLQSFEASSTSLLGLIQEVELVSRGYRLSMPLPPVSRLDSNTSGQTRKGARFRRNLQQSYATATPAIRIAINAVQSMVEQDTVERFLDVYDVHSDDIEEASLDFPAQASEEGESLKNLRILHARYSTLRRLLLCSLLSLQATGRRADAVRWRTAVANMEAISTLLRDCAQKLNSLLNGEDQPPSPSSPTLRVTSQNHHPSHSRVESQVRRISAMSTGIRSLQAKLHLLREESARVLATPTSEDELSLLSASLREQYEGLGSDLQALMQAWESGKQALSQNITKQAHRVSRSSSLSDDAGRHRLSSGSGLPSVSEVPLPLSPPATEDGSEDMNTEEEVFEAISSPRQRKRTSLGLSREERIVRMQDERERVAKQRESRDIGTNMVKELQSVMRMRDVPAS